MDVFYIALQLTEATAIIDQQQFTDGRDRRQSPLLKRNGSLDTLLLYRALKTSDSSPDLWTKFIWKNKAPPRVQFFGWLLSQCKANLARKGIVENSECEVCQEAEETPAHVIFGCTAAREFWEAIQITTDRYRSCKRSRHLSTFAEERQGSC